jgi:hypothetical protein
MFLQIVVCTQLAGGMLTQLARLRCIQDVALTAVLFCLLLYCRARPPEVRPWAVADHRQRASQRHGVHPATHIR